MLLKDFFKGLKKHNMDTWTHALISSLLELLKKLITNGMNLF